MIELQEDMAITLCMLKTNLAIFYDVMTHLFVHLVQQLDICRSVHARWMYPLERHLKILKSYVQNCKRPKTSMAEGYAIYEVFGFCT